MKRLSINIKIYAAILLISAAPAFLLAAGRQETERYSENFFALGTVCTISFNVDKSGKAAGSEYSAEDVLSKAERIIKDIENEMSVNIKDSYISRVNKAAGLSSVAVSVDTARLIEAGIEYSRLSGRAFDISIGPLVTLWGIGDEGASVPGGNDIAEALALVDYRLVEVRFSDGSSPEIFLPRTGMKLEPGGIAKGYAADKTAEYLTSIGIESALINLGGNVLAMGRKQDGSKWRIGIQNPDNTRGEYLGVLTVEDMSVVSSGKYERFFIQDGMRYHHILSTETGFPVENGIAQVSIVSPDSMTADALSTLVFSLGLEKGLELLKGIEQAEAIVIMENGDIHITPGLKDDFKLTDSSFKIRGE